MTTGDVFLTVVLAAWLALWLLRDAGRLWSHRGWHGDVLPGGQYRYAIRTSVG